MWTFEVELEQWSGDQQARSCRVEELVKNFKKESDGSILNFRKWSCD